VLAAAAAAGALSVDDASPAHGRRRTRTRGQGEMARFGPGRAPPRYRHLSGGADLPEGLLDEVAVYGFVDG